MLGRQPESPTRDRFKYDADVEAEQAVPANEVPMKRDHWMKGACVPLSSLSLIYSLSLFFKNCR